MALTKAREELFRHLYSRGELIEKFYVTRGHKGNMKITEQQLVTKRSDELPSVQIIP